MKTLVLTFRDSFFVSLLSLSGFGRSLAAHPRTRNVKPTKFPDGPIKSLA